MGSAPGGNPGARGSAGRAVKAGGHRTHYTGSASDRAGERKQWKGLAFGSDMEKRSGHSPPGSRTTPWRTKLTGRLGRFLGVLGEVQLWYKVACYV